MILFIDVAVGSDDNKDIVCPLGGLTGSGLTGSGLTGFTGLSGFICESSILSVGFISYYPSPVMSFIVMSVRVLLVIAQPFILLMILFAISQPEQLIADILILFIILLLKLATYTG